MSGAPDALVDLRTGEKEERSEVVPELIQLQYQGTSSSRLTQKAHMGVLKMYVVAPVREIFEQLGDSGSLSPDKKKSLVEKAPEDHLAEQRKVSTVFVEIKNLEQALLSGDLDKVQTCFLTIKLCVEDKRGMLRQFIVDDKGPELGVPWWFLFCGRGRSDRVENVIAAATRLLTEI